MDPPVDDKVSPPRPPSIGENDNFFTYFWAPGVLRLLLWGSPSTADINILDPIRLKFHPEWLHANCPVYNWYKRLAAVSTTRFACVDYRSKTLSQNDAEYCVEYLILVLADGSVCRLQREARQVDSIRWFPAHSHLRAILGSKLKEPSKNVMTVTFPQDWDLLDVLAICYNINKLRDRGTPFQFIEEFNTFFCSTILTILARFLVKYEKAALGSAWSSLVQGALDRLRLKRCQESYEHVGLGVCDLLDPSHPNPRHFILDPLRRNIRMRALKSYLAAASKTLWFSEQEKRTECALETYVSDATYTALTGDGVSATWMRVLLEPKGEHGSMKLGGITPEFTQALRYESFHAFSEHFHSQNMLKTTRDPRWFGQNNPLGNSFCTFLEPISQIEDDTGEEEMTIAQVCTQAAAQHEATLLRSQKTHTIQDSRVLTLSKVLLSPICDTQHKKLAAFSLSCDGIIDWNACIGRCFSREIVRSIAARFPESNPRGIHLQVQTPETARAFDVSVLNFRRYIQNHIREMLLKAGSIIWMVELDNLDSELSQVWELVESYRLVNFSPNMLSA